MNPSSRIVVIFILLIVTLTPLQSNGWTIPPPAAQESKGIDLCNPAPDLEEKWGIQILGIRLTAAGQMLDFRYRVIHPEKASSLVKRESEAYLIDQSTGAKVSVPRTKLGPMRQTAVHPLPNRIYFILFSNPGRLLAAGSKVTLVMGDLKVENLVIE